MHCTRVLQLSSSPLLSADMAMRICLASSPPLRSFLGNYDKCRLATSLFPTCRTPRPCLVSTPATTKERNDGYGDVFADGEDERDSPPASGTVTPTRKKQVVFADARGLALTDIMVYKDEDPLQFSLSDLEGVLATVNLAANPDSDDFVLDFTPPSEDYLDLRQRLKAQQVTLENCSIQEGSLTGTIKVQNISFEKSVSLRITFDQWSSHEDFPCQYLNNVYGCRDTDTFSFSIPLPDAPTETSRVEFCICYQAQDQTFWDNNHGANYGLVPAECEPHSRKSKASVEMEEKLGAGRYANSCDRFGSPRMSTGVFPGWQSWACIDTGTASPYW